MKIKSIIVIGIFLLTIGIIFYIYPIEVTFQQVGDTKPDKYTEYPFRELGIITVLMGAVLLISGFIFWIIIKKRKN